MFNFVGTGSAFHTKRGNNSAYIKRGKTLLLIDCGSANFDRILGLGLLRGIEEIHVLLTHLHPDHVGSLGDLIFYTYYKMKPFMEPKLIVHAPNDLSVVKLLEIMGVQIGTYAYNGFPADKTQVLRAEDFHLLIDALEVSHAPELENSYAYSIYDHSNCELAYYSGDSNMFPEEFMQHVGLYDYIFQDTCSADYDGNVHMSLKKLEKLIPLEFREKVHCMHTDRSFDGNAAFNLGFNTVVSF
ncbi:MBL fold metallo-hydrolase [Paenibacillus sp. FSL R7-0302]|uniref:MBL fold metallo-hydrolase n=1 Tax=Paenibacillus sp. FSL R7-0302 TaxID=2921681 RepID=UPI0030F70CFA